MFRSIIYVLMVEQIVVVILKPLQYIISLYPNFSTLSTFVWFC